MRIALFTNTYLPHVGGVARSVSTLETACRKLGHDVRVIAPEFENAESDPNVLRVPAIRHFNRTDFSVQLPVPGVIGPFIEEFRPDIVHSHHPFLLGSSALRSAWKMRVPILFTHHTLYERYTHYMPLDSPALKRVVIRLATEYCNLCDAVIAPSESIADLLKTRGVEKPVFAVPTGIDVRFFANGNAARFRRKNKIAPEAKVLGYTGRLAEEKNLRFLADAVGQCLGKHPEAAFLLVGEGDALESTLSGLRKYADESQIHAVGNQVGDDLADAYAALDWFVFASQTETQGIVLAEAMAAGKAVIALDGSGVREIVRDGRNGLLLPADASTEEFAAAIERMMSDESFSLRCSEQARESAAACDIDSCTRRIQDFYTRLIEEDALHSKENLSVQERFIMGIEHEWALLTAQAHALNAATDKRTKTGP